MTSRFLSLSDSKEQYQGGVCKLPSQMWLARLAHHRDVKLGAMEVSQSVLEEG